MKRLIIIVEGDTEAEFVKNMLVPYLNTFGINYVSTYKIKHSRGGLTKYGHLKKDILNCIYQKDTIITTLIDYYALPTDFPEYQEISSKNLSNFQKVEMFEKAILEDINLSQNIQFINLIPYIQLHEFEALIFSNIKVFENYFTDKECNFKELTRIMNEFNNPEDINNSKNTAPSKRLINNISSYNKVLNGNIILLDIGINTILQKCKRINSWVEKIIATCKE